MGKNIWSVSVRGGIDFRTHVRNFPEILPQGSRLSLLARFSGDGALLGLALPLTNYIFFLI